MRIIVLVLLAVTYGMAAGPGTPADPPAGSQSGMPFLTKSPDGSLYLSWIDTLPANQGHALRYSRWTGRGWTAPETIAQARNWFVNWADFPAIEVLADGAMLAHWLARPDSGGKYGYGIRVARRDPGPRGTWRPIASMNENDPEDYAGFLSFAGPEAVYLSPPQSRNHVAKGHDEGEMKTLRFVRVSGAGRVLEDRLLDPDVCSCCQTAVVRTAKGLLVAYRDHLPGEIRDISIVRVRNGVATEPAPLHRDGWKINGCPTEGPSIATAGRSVGIAWMTRANDTPRLQMAWSADAGDRFASPVRADDGNPVGRPNLTPVDDRQSLLVWLERLPNATAELRLRRVYADGAVGPSIVIATPSAARSTGLPKVGLAGDQVLVAWREERVRAVTVGLRSVPAKEQANQAQRTRGREFANAH